MASIDWGVMFRPEYRAMLLKGIQNTLGLTAGAIVGGLVGNQIENSAPATAAAPVASGPARVDYVPETRTVQRCRTVYDGRDEIVGYNVAYRYQGRDYTTRMAYDPGPTMNVRVNLAPDVPPPVRRP